MAKTREQSRAGEQITPELSCCCQLDLMSRSCGGKRGFGSRSGENKHLRFSGTKARRNKDVGSHPKWVGIKMKLSVSAQNSHTSIIRHPPQNRHARTHARTRTFRRLHLLERGMEVFPRGTRFVVSTSATAEPVFTLPNSRTVLKSQIIGPKDLIYL